MLASGCATARWTMMKPFRSPGEEIRDLPDAVWEQYDCGLQKRPFFVVEENELFPDRVRAGAAFGHSMVYAMCPPGPTEVVAGRLSTRIRFKGEPIADLAEDDYEIKPGRWAVHTLVELLQSRPVVEHVVDALGPATILNAREVRATRHSEACGTVRQRLLLARDTLIE